MDYSESMSVKTPSKAVVKKPTRTPTQSVAGEPAPEEHVEEENPEEHAFPHDSVTLLSWHAPGRPFKKHSREYYFNSFLIVVAIEVILFFFSMYPLMMVVLALVFLQFAMAIVPPRMYYYKITTEGIRIENHFFIWEELYDFYFLRQHSQEVLYVRTKAFFPGELAITMGDIPPEQLKAVLILFLPFREYVHPTFMERAGHWLERNFPLEKTA